MTVSVMYKFRRLSNNSLLFSKVSLIFRIHTPGEVSFRRKRKPKVFEFENAIERETKKKFLLSLYFKMRLKLILKIILKPL